MQDKSFNHQKNFPELKLLFTLFSNASHLQAIVEVMEIAIFNVNINWQYIFVNYIQCEYDLID